MHEFVHLHLHSEYSLLDSTCRIKDIVEKAVSLGHKAVAITDHGVMYGAFHFFRECKKQGIKPIIGAELYVSPTTRFDKSRNAGKGYHHLVLLAKNKKGYENLIYLVSKSFKEGFYVKPRVDIELLESHSEGLIALSGCIGGYIPQKILSAFDNEFTAKDEKSALEEARDYARRLEGIFGKGNFYLEIQNHSLDDEITVYRELVKMSEELDIPLVATNDVHYIERADADTQAILTCIQTGNVYDGTSPIGFETKEYYYKSSEEMYALFANNESAIANTVKIAEMCDFEFETDKVILPRFTPYDNSDPADYLRKLAYSGLSKKVEAGEIRYDSQYTEKTYKDRIDYELSVIISMGYSEYYLIVWDFVGYAKRNLIPTGPGRGSGAGSIIAYLLDITEIDPIRFELYFERFLNPERVSMPDFDIDFCYTRRQEVIDYVKQKYGYDNVSQIITFGTLSARAAIRDVGRALGMPYAKVDRVAKSISSKVGTVLSDEIKKSELHELYSNDPEIRKLIDVSLRIEGLPRHSSTHAAGVVVTDKPVYRYVPLAGSGISSGAVSNEASLDIYADNDSVTQYDMESIASLGLLKFDFLGLRYLTIISDAQKLINKKHPDFDVRKIPVDDKKTFDMISRGETSGMFQIESAGMTRLMTQLKPRCIEDIMVAISLFRPGPMDKIQEFLDVRDGKQSAKYLSDKLVPILSPTSGCIVYQEQIMQIFRELASYSFGKADIVRRAIAKKKSGVIEKEQAGFIEGASKNGIPEDEAKKIFSLVESFSYAFPKAHAAAYSLTAYRTAYLKCHYTREYMAALLNSVVDNKEKLSEYITECKKYSISVLPPDINESELGFTVVKTQTQNDVRSDIRFGLGAVKNVGVNFINKVVSERNSGAFTGFIDFVERLSGSELNKRQVESLIKCGAFDSMGVKRSSLIVSYEDIIDRINAKRRSNISGQIDMFSMDTEISKNDDFDYPDIPEFTRKEMLYMEKDSTGFFFTGHILDDYSYDIEERKPTNVYKISGDYDDEGIFDKMPVRVCGIVTGRVDKTTKSEKRMSFVTVEDRTGEIEVLVFPAVFENCKEILTVDSVLCVEGELSLKEDERPKILAKKIMTLKLNSTKGEQTMQDNKTSKMADDGNTSGSAAKKVYLRVASISGDVANRALALVQIFPGKVPFVFYETVSKKYISTGLFVSESDFVLNELSEIGGKDNVVVR